MEKVTINGIEYELNTEKAKELGLLKPTYGPMSWDEYVRQYHGKSFWVLGSISSKVADNPFAGAYNDFKKADETESFAALGKLYKLYKEWVKDFDRFSLGHTELYYTIRFTDLGFEVVETMPCQRLALFAFTDKYMAYTFLETFKKLFDEAKLFL